MTREEKIAAISNKNERIFAQNFFDHDEWECQPSKLDLGGFTYRPDFYDRRRGIYIEVAGTRQAFLHNIAKYYKMVEVYGAEKFEIRNPDGDLISLKKGEVATIPLWDVVGMYQQYNQAAIKFFNHFITRKKYKLEDIAIRAFPDDDNALQRLNLILQGELSLSLIDFCCICHAVYATPSMVIMGLDNIWRKSSYLYPPSKRAEYASLSEIVSLQEKVIKKMTPEEYKAYMELE